MKPLTRLGRWWFATEQLSVRRARLILNLLTSVVLIVYLAVNSVPVFAKIGIIILVMMAIDDAYRLLAPRWLQPRPPAELTELHLRNHR